MGTRLTNGETPIVGEPAVGVLIADDHEMFREMLRLALPRGPGVEIVGEAADGRQLKAAVERCKPEVVLLDYKMPFVPDFTELVREIRSHRPEIQVVVLSGFASVEVATRAARGGARGYVLKSTRLSAVADALRSVARGGAWIDPSLDRQIFDVFQKEAASLGGNSDGGECSLTRREREVLACVADGLSNRAVAEKLCISEQTVKAHLYRIFAKLGVSNRTTASLSFFGRRGAETNQVSQVSAG